MTINETLAAALAAVEQWEKDQVDDSSASPVSQFANVIDDIVVAVPANTNTRLFAVPPKSETVPSVESVNTLPRHSLQIKNLDEKAVLVQVKRRMYSPYKLDTEESRAYGAGNVNKHLFEGRNNRVKEAISKYTEVYTYAKDNTVPWTTGVELLNIDHYMFFTAGLRQLIDKANDAVDDLVQHWDHEVTADLARLADIAFAKGKPNLANPNDYPDAAEVRAKFSIEVRYMPVPTTGDFRVGISDEDKDSLQRQLDDASANASAHVLNQMIEPMQRAVSKLAVTIGDDGHIFRDSLIDNMVEVSSRMAKINISDDPEITERIKDLQSLVGTYANNKDVLRNNQSVRQKAASQIDALCGQMAGLV